MDIDTYWLDDAQMIELSMLTPSTQLGRELMEDWPGKHPELIQSEAYRGCATGLWMLFTELGKEPLSLRSMLATIELAQHEARDSQRFPSGSPGLGGLVLALVNSWERVAAGIAPTDVYACIESEAIFAARKFRQARHVEGSPV